MSTATVSLTVKYTGPGGTSQTVAMSGTPSYAAESIGIIDIPDLTAVDTEFVIPFGSIASAKVLVLKNTNNVDVAIEFNGGAVAFRLAPSGMVNIVEPVAPGAVPVASAKIKLISEQAGAGSFEYMVFGA